MLKMRITVDKAFADSPGQEVEVDCAHVEGGLAVTADANGNGWRVTHTRSGLSLGGFRHVPQYPESAPLSGLRPFTFPTVKQAVQGLRAILPLAEWQADAEALRQCAPDTGQEIKVRFFEVVGNKAYARFAREGKT